MIVEAALRRSLLVVPSINGGPLLERMLPTLQIPSELVLILDQGSTDNTEEICGDAGVGLLQLGRPHTYTEACNIGAEVAKNRGCDFIFVANNDIAFTTDVVRELLAELLADPYLGVVAPAQMIIDTKTSHRVLAYRAYWDLETLTFAHDVTPPRGNTHRLEADFCELTLAGVRMSAVDKIGFLDNAYGFYHEDADFGFRLQVAGYTCAYLPNSQIEHWTSSTFSSKSSKFKSDYLERNKKRFASKFLGRYVSYANHNSNDTNSWNIINKNLHPYLRRYGLVHPDAPELIFSHPGAASFDYLYTVWETSRLPEQWLAFKNSYRMTLTTSHWGLNVLQRAGFNRVHYAPLGVESDAFQPWGPSQRFADGKTFLWFSRNQYRKGLDLMLKAWRPFHQAQPGARLILMGVGIQEAMPTPDSTRIWKQFRIGEYRADGISVYECIVALDEETLATVYRSVDFTVCSSRSEGFGFSIAESMACGTPSIFGNFSSTSDFAFPGALLLDGVPTRADYSDKGFGDVGDWWEPSIEHLVALLFEACDMDAERYRLLSEMGTRIVRTKFSWRATSLSIRRALIAEDEGRLSEPMLQREFTFVSGARTADRSSLPSPARIPSAVTINPSIRWKGLPARSLRRLGILSNFLADRLEVGGWRHAMSAASIQLAYPFFRKRMLWLKRRILQVPRTVKSATKPMELRHGVLFIGYAEGALGLGQAFRANLKAAEAADLPFAVYPLQVNIETRLIGPYMQHRYDKTHPYSINVIEVAADQIPEVFRAVAPQLLANSYNILCTYWELPAAPEEWRKNLADIHEIWAPNKYVATAFEHIFNGPIIVMPPAMESTGGNHPGRAYFGLGEERFYFMFSFDYYSSPFRKNPLGVLKAFECAFPRGDENVGLIVKSTGAPDHYPDIKIAIGETMSRDRRILMIDRNMPREEMLGLIQASDAYVSLHRAEGFGLGMAEAMTFGRIVIGTDYSGCTDFLSDKTGFPVPYHLRPVEPHEYPWSEGQLWAEPDHNAAVEAMRRAVANPAEGKKRGEAARDYVLRSYSTTAVGKAMRDRLDLLFTKRKAKDQNAKLAL